MPFDRLVPFDRVAAALLFEPLLFEPLRLEPLLLAPLLLEPLLLADARERVLGADPFPDELLRRLRAPVDPCEDFEVLWAIQTPP